MRRHLWPPLVAVCLLLAIATAHADCAWILWQATTNTLQAPSEPTTWNTPLACPSRDACVAVIDEYVRQWERARTPQQSVSRATTGTSAEFVTTPGDVGRTVIVRRHCLPDTVDPRGPKSK